MRALWLSAVLGAVLVFVGQPVRAAEPDTKTYEGNGLTFKYPADWTVKEDKAGGMPKITAASKDQATQVIIQSFDLPKGATAKQILDATDAAIKKGFEGKEVANSDKTAKRKLFGQEREGPSRAYKVQEGVNLTFELFAVEVASGSKVVVVSAITSPVTNDAAKKAIDTITGSLAEKK